MAKKRQIPRPKKTVTRSVITMQDSDGRLIRLPVTQTTEYIPVSATLVQKKS